MSQILFKRLTEIEKSELIHLMNHPLVRRQMPLLKGDFDETACDRFIVAKEELWLEHGFGPWAFVIDGKFAGWGGVQPENDMADLALVLHPKFWGMGKTLYHKIVQFAFVQMGLPSLTVLFPPTRTRVQGLLKLGFQENGVVLVGNEKFIRYSLRNEHSL
ncbi:MAG: GNAT family N-acetyltransferase [Allomuricauda sp.]